MARNKHQGLTEEYITGGRHLEDWKVWTALETYMQVSEVHEILSLNVTNY